MQFEEANAPVLSRDGRYVVFGGSLAGMSGVWRRELSSGRIEPVATSDPGDAALSASDAAAPSVSGDGRYVAFTTTADLDPEHTPPGGGPAVGEPEADKGCPEVYVRDMDRAPGEEGAYLLASALNGSGEGIVFSSPCATASGGFAIAGAQAAPAVAMSRDGTRVVFTVLSTSNLASGPGGALATPASQVAVRNLRTHTTTLVSVTPEGQSVPGGGAYPSAESEQQMHGTIGGSILGDEPTGSSAAISADGSTVTWLGTDVPAQVPGSAQEIESDTKHVVERTAAGSEAEPLWRRVQDGSAAATRRLLAGAGLDFFYNSYPEEPVTAGSYPETKGFMLFVPPAISEDGSTVALTSNAPRPAAARSAELSGNAPTTDLYAIRIGDDPTVQPQVMPLTETPDYDTTQGALGPIKDVAISADGTRVAFDSSREQLALPSLALVSLPATSFAFQTYEANLTLGTLQRATVTYDGSEPKGGASLLSFSGDGHALAFASEATNLFFGDAMRAPEVYLAHELPSELPAAASQIGPAAADEPLPVPEWRLSATAVARPDGSVLVHARTPGVGLLHVAAEAQLPAAEHASAHRRRSRRATRAHPSRAQRSGRPACRSRPPAHTGCVRLLTRTVATAQMVTGSSGEAVLRLEGRPAYRAPIGGARGLYSVVQVTFTAPGHSPLGESIPVTFRRTIRRGHGSR